MSENTQKDIALNVLCFAEDIFNTFGSTVEYQVYFGPFQSKEEPLHSLKCRVKFRFNFRIRIRFRFRI